MALAGRILFLALVFSAANALAVTTSPFTYHGRILLPSNLPEQDSNVQFKLQILSPGSNCLMYEETQTLNMTGSNGIFALTLNGLSSTRTDAAAYTIEQIMGNLGSFSFAGGSCTYTPAAFDGRVFQVQFFDSTMGGIYDSFPPTSIAYVPKAIDAEQVAGFPATSLLRVENATVPGAAASFTSAQFTALQDLIAGTSALYAPPGGGGGGTASGVSAANGTAAAPSISFSSDTGTGFYDAGAHTIGVSANGTEVMSMGSTGIAGTGAMTIAAGGTNQAMTVDSSGTGSVNLGTGNGTDLSVLDSGAPTANYVTIKGAASGGSPTIGTRGSDPNINLTFTPKGTGNTIFSSGATFSNDIVVGTGGVLVGDGGLWSNLVVASGFGSGTVGGFNNTIVGSWTAVNTSGNSNTALGFGALYNSTGSSDVAVGTHTLLANTTGANNAALGNGALQNNTTGNNNIAFGTTAGGDLTTGGQNIFLGYYPTANVGITTGSNNIMMGYDVRPPSQTAGNQLNIGNLIYATGLGSGSTVSAGNVGIGTTSPGYPLDVRSSSSTNPSLNVVNSGNAADFPVAQFLAPNLGVGNEVYYTFGTAASNNNSATIGFANLGAGDPGNFIGFNLYGGNYAMAITGAGNVGIGTTSPNQALQVNGQIASLNVSPFASTTYTGGLSTQWTLVAQINIVNRFDAVSTYLDVVGGTSWMYDGASAQLYFKVKGQNIDGGFADLYVINSTYPLSASDFAVYYYTQAGSYVQAQVWAKMELDWDSYQLQAHDTYITSVDPSNPSTLALFNNQPFQASPPAGSALAYSGISLYNGNVGIGTWSPTTPLQVAGEISPSADNTYTLGDGSLRFTAVYAVNGMIQTSDRREKKDIQGSDLGLDFINTLQPVSYYWKKGDSDLHYGLIAQDTEKAIKDAKTQAGSRVPADAHIIVDHDPKSDRYGIRYTELLSPVIKAIQEIYTTVTGIKAENERLKQENAAIKGYLCAKDPNAPLCK